MADKQWEVGQLVLRERRPQRRGGVPELEWVRVKKVGRKYVTVEHQWNPGAAWTDLGQFHKDTGAEKTDFTVYSCLYLGEEEYQAARLRDAQIDALRQEIHRNYNWFRKISDSTLQCMLQDLGASPNAKLPKAPAKPEGTEDKKC